MTFFWLIYLHNAFNKDAILLFLCYSGLELSYLNNKISFNFSSLHKKDVFLTTQSNLNKTVILFFFIRKMYNHMVYSWKWNSQFQMLFDPCSFHLCIDKQYVGFSNLTFLMRHYEVIQLFWIVTGTITQYIFMSHFNSVYLLISLELVHSSL